MTVKEFRDRLDYLIATFQVPEDASILITKKEAYYDPTSLVALLHHGKVTINLELVDAAHH